MQKLHTTLAVLALALIPPVIASEPAPKTPLHVETLRTGLEKQPELVMVLRLHVEFPGSADAPVGL